MSFVNVGTLGAVPGKRDLLVEILTRRSADLEAAGCLLYEVGVNDEQPDTVFVAELWTSGLYDLEGLLVAGGGRYGGRGRRLRVVPLFG